MDPLQQLARTPEAAIALILALLAALGIGVASSQPQAVGDLLGIDVQKHQAPVGEPPRDTTSKPIAVSIIGDSYTELAATKPQNWARLVSENLCWQTRYFAQGSTGYVNEAGGKGNYLSRTPAASATNPQVVIVQGSLNDARDAERVRGKVRETLSVLKQGLPQSQIIALGMIHTPRFNGEVVDRVNEETKAGAADAGVTYIDGATPNWLQRNPNYFRDGTHLNTAGDSEFARLVTDALRGVGVREGDCA